MEGAANAFIGEQVGADIRQWMRLNPHQTHVGAADAAHAHAGLTMPVARSQKLDEGGGQNRIFRTGPTLNLNLLTNDSILKWPNRCRLSPWRSLSKWLACRRPQ